MQPRLPHKLAAAFAAWILLPGAAPAQVSQFTQGPSLSPEDSRLLLETTARLNATEPTRVGDSTIWSNPQTNVSGTNTVLGEFRSDGRACHVMQHHIAADGTDRDYRVTWCRTPSGEWKTYSLFGSSAER